MKALVVAALLALTTGSTTETTSTTATKAQVTKQPLPKFVQDRRDELRVKMDVLAEAYGADVHAKVKVEKILFGTVLVNKDKDSAIVVFSYGKTTEAMLLIFHPAPDSKGDDGTWDALPESFQSTTL